MKANLISQQENGRMLDKELVASFVAVAIDEGQFREPVHVKCWMGRSSGASTVYASVWINGHDYHTSGRGQAGGYGYCKQSAAVHEAFRSAGIDFDQHWHGAGESKIIEAMQAICQSLGFNNVHIVRA